MSTTEERVKFFSDNATFYNKANEFTARFAATALTFVHALDASSVVHDNASGPGIVSFTIAKKFTNKDDAPRIYGTDLAPGMVELMNTQIKAKDLVGKVSAEIMDARDLSVFEEGKFSHSFTHFAIMMAGEDAIKVASEIYRTLQPNGTACVTTWKQSATDLIDNVARRIRPHEEPYQPIPKEWKTKEHLAATLVAAGFREENIEVHLKEDGWEFESEQDRWEYFTHPFWGLFRPGWTEEEAAQWDDVMKEELIKVAGPGGEVRGAAWLAIAKK
jgi:ubiquinone/menaquinone biosynthesis C-methylase UbiE